jgi:hypothetical protein
VNSSGRAVFNRAYNKQDEFNCQELRYPKLMRGYKPLILDRWIQIDEPGVGNKKVILVEIQMRG